MLGARPVSRQHPLKCAAASTRVHTADRWRVDRSPRSRSEAGTNVSQDAFDFLGGTT